MVRKSITAFFLFSFIVIGFVDALLHGEVSYSSIMGRDINRVYFYTFCLLIVGCWLLYNKFFVGIGFITVATFNGYFVEYIFLHNYFASVMIYAMLVVDILHRRKAKWLIPFFIIGIIQAIAFQSTWLSQYIVGGMEFLSLCIGSVFVIRII